MKISATVFYSFLVCPREAWFYYYRIFPDVERECLVLGRLVHESFYKKFRKEILIDDLVKLDLLRGKLLAEVKKSSRHKEAAKLQLAFYLYYLKHKKGIEIKERNFVVS